MFTYCISLLSTLVEYILYPCTESTILRARTDVEGCLRALYNLPLFQAIPQAENGNFRHKKVSITVIEDGNETREIKIQVSALRQ